MKKLSRGRIKRIHVSQVKIRAARKDASVDDVFTIQMSDGPLYASSVKIAGPSELIFSPCDPLKCGARVWIETRSAVEYEESKG
jgi:hypothetical protein